MAALPSFLSEVFYHERTDGLAARLAFSDQFHHIRKADEVSQIKRIVTVIYLVFLGDLVGALGFFLAIISLDIFGNDIVLAIIMAFIMMSGFVAFALIMQKRLKSILDNNPVINNNPTILR
jgi:uncharacterized membrane protein (DUF485 family)